MSLGEADRAISALRRALRADDSDARAHHDLGAAYLRSGAHAEAEFCFRCAIGRRPDFAAAWTGLGAALLAQGRLGESRRAYQRGWLLGLRALLPGPLRWKVAAPPPAAADEGLAAALTAQAREVERLLAEGSASRALAAARAIAAQAPRSARARRLLGIAADEAGAGGEAIENLEAAVSLRPDDVDAHLGLARAYSRSGRLREAAASAGAALRLDPGSAAVLAAVAGSLLPWNEPRAEALARRALELEPGLEAAHANLAAALWGQGRLEEAERHCREAMRRNPAALVHKLNLALILRHRGRLAEALALYRSLEPESSGSARLCADLGTLIVESGGDPEEARGWLRRAQSLADDPRAELFEATLDLRLGNFAAGWERYEARKRTHDQHWHRPLTRFAEWRGEPLGGERLLVYCEQSLGDAIMFASMIPDALRLAPRLVLLCEPRLGALFARSFASVEVLAAPLERQPERLAAITGVARQIATGSLGGLFRRRAEDFPAHSGYLAPDAGAVSAWRERLERPGGGLKVGISWQGGVQGTGRSRRSVALEALAPVLAQPGVRWISLQHGEVGDEIERCAAATGVRVSEHPGVTGDIDALAALISSLDLVISVCNTNVHLAGALGKEVWVMAPLVPEWRYGASGERMPWYPSARILRQRTHGDWSEVLREVAARLAARAGRQASET
jgi:tetratricopeptide (TPR) repeat protein